MDLQLFVKKVYGVNMSLYYNDIVDHAKILGMIISNDLKWNKHVASVVLKASIEDCP